MFLVPLRKNGKPVFSKILKIFEKTGLPFFRCGTRNTFYFVDFPHTNPPNPTWYDLFRLSHSLKNKTLTPAPHRSRAGRPGVPAATPPLQPGGGVACRRRAPDTRSVRQAPARHICGLSELCPTCKYGTRIIRFVRLSNFRNLAF